jgi:molecular chaperone DnaK
MEVVTARNQLDSLVHSVRKSLKDYGDKLGADEKSKIEGALKDAEEALKSDDKKRIDDKAQVLAQAAQKLGEKVYAESQQKQGAPGEAEAKASKPADDGNVVDAEFTEVKDRKG